MQFVIWLTINSWTIYSWISSKDESLLKTLSDHNWLWDKLYQNMKRILNFLIIFAILICMACQKTPKVELKKKNL